MMFGTRQQRTPKGPKNSSTSNQTSQMAAPDRVTCQARATACVGSCVERDRVIYVSKGFPHGFQTLSDNAETVYKISESYPPNSAGGYRLGLPRSPSYIGISYSSTR